MKETPTNEMYAFLQNAYDYFNATLFNNELPHCLLTLQRKNGAGGYFSPNRFVNHKNQKTDEIALNPSVFAIKSVQELLSILVHEQVHLWQEHYGKPSRRRYHNKEWGDKMKKIGLYPSDTGKEGGKETGEAMAHYIIKNGAFEIASKELITQYEQFPWLDTQPPYSTQTLDGIVEGLLGNLVKTQDGDFSGNPFVIPPNKKSNKSNRSKYTCPCCKTSVWGKPNISILCGNPDCGPVVFEEDS